jgi:hypothetical protein
MVRFNGHDRRMERSLEAAISQEFLILVLMEAFRSVEHKFDYRLFGHSGDGPLIELFKKGYKPRNEKEIFDVLAKMNAHATHCLSGGFLLLT